jgi:hypothetical protein
MYNHHNPTLVQPMMQKALDALGDNWEDVSYGNDCCASISIVLKKGQEDEELIELYFPNATEEDADNEEFSHFAVSHKPNHYKHPLGDEWGSPFYNSCPETLEEAILEAKSLQQSVK